MGILQGPQLDSNAIHGLFDIINTKITPGIKNIQAEQVKKQRESRCKIY